MGFRVRCFESVCWVCDCQWIWDGGLGMLSHDYVVVHCVRNKSALYTMYIVQRNRCFIFIFFVHLYN